MPCEPCLRRVFWKELQRVAETSAWDFTAFEMLIGAMITCTIVMRQKLTAAWIWRSLERCEFNGTSGGIRERAKLGLKG